MTLISYNRCGGEATYVHGGETKVTPMAMSVGCHGKSSVEGAAKYVRYAVMATPEPKARLDMVNR